MPSRLSVRLLLISIFFLPLFTCSAAAQDEKKDPNFAKLPPHFEKEEGFVRHRMDWFYHQRAYPNQKVPAGARMRALEQRDAMLAQETAEHIAAGLPLPSSSWTAIGPQPADSFGLVSSGRVTAVAIDPTNTQIIYAGAADGGVWKTTNGGTSWTPLTDTQASLSVGSIALDPQNHNIIYVGTGELNNAVDSYYGAGILKSTDGGTTWTNYPSLFAGGSGGGSRIGGIAVHPTNSQIVLAAVGYGGQNNWGVFRSTDGGQTWTNVLFNGSQAYNVIFDFVNPNNVYASLDGNGVWKSTDAGITWTADNGSGSTSLPTGSAYERVALAIDPNNSSTLYAGVANTPFGGPGTLAGLFKTTNGGSSWTQLTNTPNYCGGQCWYDNVIAVAPGNSNLLFAGGDGGTPLARSPDGGNSWTTYNSIHADLHALAFTPNGAQLIIGNDGGMYSAASLTTTPVFTSLNSTIETLQFYPGPAINPSNASQGFAGTQDNGTLQYSGSLAWTGGPYCGDGTRNLIDPSNTNTIYESCTQLAIGKSTDGGVTVNSAQNGIDPSGTDSVNWVAPFTMDPSNSQNLYFGSNFVYQTTNGATTWSAISPDLTGGGGNNLSALAVAPTDSNTVYSGSGDSTVHVTRNALMGAAATWTNISSTTALPNRYITAIAVDPSSSSTAYVTFSGFSGFGDNLGHIFKTTNAGTAWTDVSGDLPNVPVNDVVVDPVLSQTMYIATDVGVFYTTSGGTSWATLVTGLPNVTVTGLAYQKATNTLWAGTHGRSIWFLNVASLTAVPTLTSISPTSALVGGLSFTLTVNGTAFTSSSVAQWNGAALSTTFVNSTQLTASVPAGDVAVAGTTSVAVLNGTLASNSATFAINNPVPVLTSLSPTSATAGGAGLTLTINGSNFVNGASVLWNGSSRTTTFVSSTQVTATITASDIATAGTASVTLSNPAPGGGTSAALTFTINNPVPTLTSLSPSSKTAPGAAFTLTVNGTNFVRGATVNWNGSARTTTFVSSTKVTASITTADVSVAGSFPVTVTNPTPGGGTSGSLTFTVNNPKPTVSSLSPASATAGGAAFTLTVNGTNFVATSIANWAGSARTTTFVSTTKLTAAITAIDIATAGTFKVTVTNPAPGGGTSGSQNFTVNNAVPTLTSISPTSATAGGATFTLTATGTNYVSGSKVEWNGAKLTTTFVSSTSLTASVPAADIKNAGTASVTVNNPTPGGGNSGSKTFTINNPVPTITTLSPSSATHGGAAFTLTVTGTNFVSTSTVRWNGSNRTTTFVSATKVTAAITAADIATAGSANVTVNNPTPGGGISGASTFTIK